LARILGDSRFGIRQAGKPPGVPMPHVVCQGCGFFLLGSGIGLGLLLRQLTRMHHHKAQFLLGDAPIAVFDLHLSAHPLAMPAAWFFGLRPAGFLHQERLSGVLASGAVRVSRQHNIIRDKTISRKIITGAFFRQARLIRFGAFATAPQIHTLIRLTEAVFAAWWLHKDISSPSLVVVFSVERFFAVADGAGGGHGDGAILLHFRRKSSRKITLHIE
jgi:hypothetical protein